MPRYAFVNGAFIPHAHASLHIEDRGTQFADAVYEVITLVGGKTLDAPGHWARLARSLDALDIPMPLSAATFALRCQQLVAKNRVTNGLLYIQVSRGIAPRNHLATPGTKPSVIITARAAKLSVDCNTGLSVRSVPDERWARVDIKTTGLLANTLAKTQATHLGYDDAWMIDAKGYVTEGTSNNAWIVCYGTPTRIITRKASRAILNGITRMRVLSLAGGNDWQIEERAFTRDEALAADEAFVTSATAFVKPVVRLDDHAIGTGTPGRVTKQIGAAYQGYIDQAPTALVDSRA